MQSRKIIFIGPAHPFRGGIASSSEILASNLLLLGNDVEMMTYTTQYPQILFPGKSQYTDSAAPANIKISRSYSSINPLSWRRARRQIIKENPDLIVSRFWLPYLGVSAAHLLKPYPPAFNIKRLSIVDNLIPHQKMIGDNFCIKHYMNSHDQFIVMSSSVKEEIETRFKDKNILHIPHPVYDNYGDGVPRSEAIKKLNLDPSYKYLLFFGFIKPYKGLDLLLASLDKAYLEKHRIKLLIAGEVYGDDKPYYQKIKQGGLDTHVVFHNKFIADEMIKYYFSATDLVVQTYLSATQSGISQIALNFEKPVLVTNVGGLSEMVLDQRTGYVVEKNEGAIMSAIEDFFNHQRANTFKTDIKQLKSENTWKAFTIKMMHFVFQES